MLGVKGWINNYRRCEGSLIEGIIDESQVEFLSCTLNKERISTGKLEGFSNFYRYIRFIPIPSLLKIK